MYRYVRDRVRSILKLDDPPKKLALAASLGVFVAFTPTLGLHMLTCVLFGWLFRLNTLVIITASLVNNPWTIVPLYGFCLWFGVVITGAQIAAPDISWNSLGLMQLFDILKPFLWPFVAGTLVIGAAAACASYYLFLWFIIRYKKSSGEPDAPATSA